MRSKSFEFPIWQNTHLLENLNILKVGTECFCGNYLKTSQKRSSSECLTPCQGNKAEGCGGNWRVVIYRNNNYKSNILFIKVQAFFILKGLHNKTSTIYGKYIFSKRKKKIYVLFMPLISISLYLKVYGFKVPKDIIIYLIYCYCFPNKTCKYTFIKKF